MVNFLPPHRNPNVLREDYRRVVLFADDYLTGRIGLLVTSRVMRGLAIWMNSQDEPEFTLFTEIANLSWELPVNRIPEFFEFNGLDDSVKVALEKLEREHRVAAKAAAESLKIRYRAPMNQVVPKRVPWVLQRLALRR